MHASILYIYLIVIASFHLLLCIHLPSFMSICHHYTSIQPYYAFIHPYYVSITHMMSPFTFLLLKETAKDNRKAFEFFVAQLKLFSQICKVSCYCNYGDYE